MSTSYYIGWDVGGWNCDRNSKSRDALVVLNDQGKVLGESQRINLTKTILESQNSLDFIKSLLHKCGIYINSDESEVVMAIDTPLGFSKGFLDLISSLVPTKMDEKCEHTSHPYLFRETERFLSKNGFTPLSAVKDMIGSQATKGMHVLAKFAPSKVETGVWQDRNRRLTIIETYPTVNKGTADTKLPESGNWLNKHTDIQDAYICARMAYLFDKHPEKLQAPPERIFKNEGWIWALKEKLKNPRK